MLRLIVSTMSSRILIAIITFIIVVINARYFGSEGVGTIGLIMFSLSIIQLVSNFSGAGALVFLLKTYPIKPLFIITFVWSIISILFITLVLYLFNILPQNIEIHIVVLSIMISIYSFTNSYLISYQKIFIFNLLSLLQIVVLLLSILLLNKIFEIKNINNYIFSLYISYSIVSFIGFGFIIKKFKTNIQYHYKSIIKTMFRNGFYVGFASFMQLFNYRLSYFLIDTFGSRGALGIYDTATKLSEGIWLIPRSLAIIEYSKVVNSKSEDYTKKITLSFIKVAFLFCIVSVSFLLLIPQFVYIKIFGIEFIGIKYAIAGLSFGISFFSISIILSHYFGGYGKYYHNTISSGLGLIITIVAGFLILPQAFDKNFYTGLMWASIISSVSYCVSTFYQLIVFIRNTKVIFSDFIIKKEEILLVLQKIKRDRI